MSCSAIVSLRFSLFLSCFFFLSFLGLLCSCFCCVLVSLSLFSVIFGFSLSSRIFLFYPVLVFLSFCPCYSVYSFNLRLSCHDLFLALYTFGPRFFCQFFDGLVFFSIFLSTSLSCHFFCCFILFLFFSLSRATFICISCCSWNCIIFLILSNYFVVKFTSFFHIYFMSLRFFISFLYCCLFLFFFLGYVSTVSPLFCYHFSAVFFLS